MLGNLNEKQIDELLTGQVVGRIGCHAEGITYIIPVNYVYKGNTIFVHSGPGKKVEMMRKNPNVCFEVDDIASIFHWKSVIAWGTFEEIKEADEQQRAMQALIHHIMPLTDKASGHPSHGITANEYDIGTKIELVVYKITVTSKTGRFED